MKKIDLVLTNSLNTKRRIKKFLGVDAKVLYPPVDLKEFKWFREGDYYLSASRLSTAKRIDNIVKAFKKMPDKKLIVIYGTNDPQKEEIFELARGSDNINFVTLPGNVGFTEYMGSCIANICIPINEDFGMIVVESMAAGKPCIGVNEGGLKETIIDKKTGILIAEGGKVEDLIKAVEYMTPEKSLEMKKNSISQAKKFSLEEFEKQIKNYVFSLK